MDIGSYIGIFGAFGMVVFSVLVGGGNLLSILDLPSFLMVALGSYFALMLASSLSDALGVWNIFGRTFKIPVFNEQSIVQKMMAFSEKARREGLLALEDELEDLDDEFMKKGLRLMVDGTDAAVIRDLMELELTQMQSRHADKLSIVNMWAALAPGLGMLGTVVGLIGMLQNLEDKAAIGPNMALALVTTLYGSMLANLLMIPFGSKLRNHDSRETMVKEMIIEGVLSIQAGENTRILAMKLLAYLTPVVRKTMEAELLKD
ncbi:MAG: MotA/TolQ/ExbB proton channel family protein [Treponema sp.]|jgi:chemotaxis protein MotA|nr:MotA/TolQ/ExbB proton channel family protein [Treponema sp.]